MKKINACILIISIVLSAAGVSLIFTGCSKGDKWQPMNDWMSSIKDEALLKNVVMPGSHDTGTYDLEYVAQTQNRDMSAQLACGTRYFDLRFDVVDGVLVMYHGMHGILYQYKVMYDDNALTTISQIKEFLEEYPSETLILDITHIFNEAKDLLFSTVCEYLQGFAISNDTSKSDLEFVESLKLKDCRGKCLILWSDGEGGWVDNNKFIFKRNDDGGTRNDCVLHSFYNANYNGRYSSNKFISTAIPKYIDDYKETDGGLFVLQGQLTDSMGVFGPRVKEDSHCNNMNNYVQSLADSDDLNWINVIMRDFVGYKKNSYAVKLNLSKGLVKDERIDDIERICNYNIKNSKE